MIFMFDSCNKVPKTIGIGHCHGSEHEQAECILPTEERTHEVSKVAECQQSRNSTSCSQKSWVKYIKGWHQSSTVSWCGTDWHDVWKCNVSYIILLFMV